MDLVLLTALGVGGATIIGAIIGFVFKNFSHKFSDIVLSFAAGVMLAAAVLGLIMPSLDYGGDWGLMITIIGIFAGAVCLNFVDKLVPHLHRLMEPDTEKHNNSNLNNNSLILYLLQTKMKKGKQIKYFNQIIILKEIKVYSRETTNKNHSVYFLEIIILVIAIM